MYSPPSELRKRSRPPYSRYCLSAPISSLLNISFGQKKTTKLAILSRSNVISSLFLPHCLKMSSCYFFEMFDILMNELLFQNATTLYGPLYRLIIFFIFVLGLPASFFEALNIICVYILIYEHNMKILEFTNEISSHPSID